MKGTREVFRFGGPNAPEHYAFSEPVALIVDEAAFIYARLARDGAVVVFNPEGGYDRRIGRRGEGPGESALREGP